MSVIIIHYDGTVEEHADPVPEEKPAVEEDLPWVEPQLQPVTPTPDHNEERLRELSELFSI